VVAGLCDVAAQQRPQFRLRRRSVATLSVFVIAAAASGERVLFLFSLTEPFTI
jgi:hypothetical protein